MIYQLNNIFKWPCKWVLLNYHEKGNGKTGTNCYLSISK